jgi:hypothetical protein
MKMVKKYRYAVIKAQNFIRDFLNIQQARLTVVLKYADSLEAQWKAAQKKSMQKSMEDIKADDRKKSTKKSIISKNKKPETMAYNIPSDQKMHAIRQDLHQRLKIYRTQTNEYNIELEKYNYNRKTRLITGSDIPPPPKPFFKVYFIFS